MLIKDVSRFGASPRHLAYSNPGTRSGSAEHLNTTQSWSSQESYAGKILDILATPTVAALSSHAPTTKQISRRKLGAKDSATIQMSPETESATPTEPTIPRITKIIPHTSTCLIGDRAVTPFPVKRDNRGEGKRKVCRRKATHYVQLQLTTSSSSLAITRSLHLRGVRQTGLLPQVNPLCYATLHPVIVMAADS